MEHLLGQAAHYLALALDSDIELQDRRTDDDNAKCP